MYTKRIKDWKAHLNLLRELTVYLNVRDVVPIELVESISQTLQSISEGQVNADVSKKIYRVSCHILQVSKLLIIINVQYTHTYRYAYAYRFIQILNIKFCIQCFLYSKRK